MYTCLIVDDEPIARDVLAHYISKIPTLKLVGSESNSREANVFLSGHTVDILFLDIQMPGISGIDLLRTLTLKPLTILTTAYRDYALDGFEYGVLDYLVKPIKQERFTLAVQRALEILELKQNDLRELTNIHSTTKQITIKSGTKIVSLALNDITHIQGLKDYSIIYADKKKYLVKGYIKTHEANFHPYHFIRVHKSFIVAKNRVQIINKGKIEINDFQIPVGNVYRQEVDALLKLPKS